jgi:hypothetical protein
MGPAQRAQTHLGQAPVQNLALLHQVLDSASDVLDGNLRVNPVLVEEIDPVGPEPSERTFDRQLDMLRAAVQPRPTLAGLEIDVPAELRHDHRPVPEWLRGFAEDAFVLMRAIGLGAVEEGDALVVGCPDDVDHLRAVRDRRLERAVHVLDAEADAGNLQPAQPAPLVCERRGACCRTPVLGNRWPIGHPHQRNGRQSSGSSQKAPASRLDVVQAYHVGSSFPSEALVPDPEAAALVAGVARLDGQFRLAASGTRSACRRSAGKGMTCAIRGRETFHPLVA